MLKEKYDDIDYNSIKFLLKLRNIKQRTISESAQKISQEKIKQTCIEKYGVENVSQLKEIKQKKCETTNVEYKENLRMGSEIFNTLKNILKDNNYDKL